MDILYNKCKEEVSVAVRRENSYWKIILGSSDLTFLQIHVIRLTSKAKPISTEFGRMGAA